MLHSSKCCGFISFAVQTILPFISVFISSHTAATTKSHGSHQHGGSFPTPIYQSRPPEHAPSTQHLAPFPTNQQEEHTLPIPSYTISRKEEAPLGWMQTSAAPTDFLLWPWCDWSIWPDSSNALLSHQAVSQRSHSHHPSMCVCGSCILSTSLLLCSDLPTKTSAFLTTSFIF